MCPDRVKAPKDYTCRRFAHLASASLSEAIVKNKKADLTLLLKEQWVRFQGSAGMPALAALLL
jgi:hypothetical protein